MKRTRRWPALVLAAVLALGAAGCANDAQTQPADSQAASTQAQKEEPVASAPAETTQESTEMQTSGEIAVNDGTYTATVQGRNADLTVETVIKDKKISSVKVTDHMETSVYTSAAILAMEKKIAETNSTQVDAVAGATITSAAIRSAVEKCIEAAGGNPEDFRTQIPAEKGADETVTVDIAVVGAGASGILAATAAGEKGAQVALIEKTTILGGASLQSFGVTAYGTKADLEAGVDVETLKDEYFEEWITYEHWRVDGSLLRAYIDNAGRTVDYLNDHGFGMLSFPAFGAGFNMLFDYDQRMPAYEAMLETAVSGNGGTVYKETTAKSLLTDDSGAVIGVVCERADGSTLTVQAKAVVIATGGFGGDAAWVQELTGFNGVVGGLYTARGEGMKMAWEIGAKVPTNLGGLMLHQTLATANLKGYDLFHTRYPMILCYVPSLLNVSATGARFRNEGNNNTAVAASNAAAFTGGYTYVLLSQSTLDKLEQGGLAAIGVDSKPGLPPEYAPAYEIDTPWEGVEQVMKDMVDGGWGFYGETIEELAANAGFDVDTFVRTFTDYESYCAAGKDSQYLKPEQYLVAYGEGPYYLVESTCNNLGTVTGLVINDEFKVLNETNQPIPGLFAVGCDASSTLYCDMYTGSGAGMGWAFTSGLLGGESAYEYVMRQHE